MGTSYSYVCTDDSPLSSMIYEPIIENLHGYIGGKISPHVITLVGFVCVTSTSIIELSSKFRSGKYLVPLFLILYQVCDSLDGKQARKLNQSSAFGECLDHGSDTLGSISLLFIILNILKLSFVGKIRFVPIFWSCFFLAHLEGSMNNGFIFECVSAPTDGIFVIITYYFYVLWFGSDLHMNTGILGTIFRLSCQLVYISIGILTLKKLFFVIRNRNRLTLSSLMLIQSVVISLFQLMGSAHMAREHNCTDEFLLIFSLQMARFSLLLSWMKFIKLKASYTHLWIWYSFCEPISNVVFLKNFSLRTEDTCNVVPYIVHNSILLLVLFGRILHSVRKE